MFVAPPVAAQDVIISTRLPSGQELPASNKKPRRSGACVPPKS